MALQTTWFMLIAIVWAGFFVLEGFDFGVGMLVPLIGRDDDERRVVRSSIGPFWDGNEVWLIVAGGATFAAFADWYATMFSAYYLPLFVVLVALILRAAAFEYRNKRDATSWRRTWDWLMAGSSLLIPLLIGVAFGGLLNGLPIDSQKEFTGSFTDLLQPYALGTGVVFAALCLLQGCAFVRLKTAGAVADRAGGIMRAVGAVLVVGLLVHIEWTQTVADGGVIPGLGAWLSWFGVAAATWLAFQGGHRGIAFACSSVGVAFTILGFFGELHPHLMVSSTSPAYSILVSDSSSSYTLTLMTIVAAVMLPVVLLYTAWNYWVFRQRVQPVAPEPAAEPAAVTDS